MIQLLYETKKEIANWLNAFIKGIETQIYK